MKFSIASFFFPPVLQELLVEAVSFKQSFAEVHMASIEFDAKVLFLINCQADLEVHTSFINVLDTHLILLNTLILTDF